jgi:DNA modification methylase
VAFVGLSDSWEAYYQAIRRCWRYGQVRAVECHVITSTAEGAVVANIERKEREARAMGEEMVKHMAIHTTEALGATVRAIDEYERRVERGQRWEAHRADCVELAREIPADSLDFIVYSPPFASLYTYSNSPRDMGNVRTHDEFYAHFAYLTGEMFRALKPGRLMAAHCMNLPTSKARDGYIGISDFRGDLIRMFRDAGFIFHSEVCIWKDPVRAMQRTKALGLLYKQLRKDSAMSRQGIPDYLIVMRKPGENPAPVTKVAEDFPVDLWQRYASPVWFDINPSDTLQKESAREERDERHIAPLQLEVIRRAIRLWTNPGDLVYDPFGGIGSSGYVAIEEGRRALLSELKESYWRQAVANLRRAEQLTTRATLFDLDALASA